MKTIHNKIEIEYREATNRWHFELRGRQRSAESLVKAREAIDKPVDTKEEKPFKRIKVYTSGRYHADYNDSFKLGEVTSIAEPAAYERTQHVWVTIDGRREKRAAECCFPVTEPNTAIIETLAEKNKEINKLREVAEEIFEKLTKLEV